MDNNKLITLTALLLTSVLALTGCGAQVGPDDPNHPDADASDSGDSNPDSLDTKKWCAVASVDGIPFPIPVEQADTLPAPFFPNPSNLPCVRIASDAPPGLARFCCPDR